MAPGTQICAREDFERPSELTTNRKQVRSSRRQPSQGLPRFRSPWLNFRKGASSRLSAAVGWSVIARPAYEWKGAKDVLDRSVSR